MMLTSVLEKEKNKYNINYIELYVLHYGNSMDHYEHFNIQLCFKNELVLHYFISNDYLHLLFAETEKSDALCG